MKAKRLSDAAVVAARRVLDESGVIHPRDILVEEIAAKYNAWVLYGPLATARASIVRSDGRALVWIDERTKGAPWARFTVAHELGHHLMHGLQDHFEQCTGEEKSGSSYRVEQEANHFSTELLMPETLARPHANRARTPTLEHVLGFARTFATSPMASALRYVQLSEAACAVVLSEGGRIKWASESASFPGKIVQRRQLHEEALASKLVQKRLARSHGENGREVPGIAWGGERPLFEQSIALSNLGGAEAASAIGGGEKSAILSWVVAPE